MVEIAARAADGSAEVVSAAISPDTAEIWTSALSNELATNSLRRGSELVLQQTLLAARSDTVPGAFVLFVSDTAFAQIGVTVTTDEIRRFVRLLSSAASVASHLTAREFAALVPLRLTEVVPAGSSQQLPYPKALRGMRVPGEVRARFVVNSMGRVQPGTLKILYSTHPEFGEAVRSGSRGFRFIPATVNGRPVSRTVMQSFIFNM
jgi:TonB family protein